MSYWFHIARPAGSSAPSAEDALSVLRSQPWLHEVTPATPDGAARFDFRGGSLALVAEPSKNHCLFKGPDSDLQHDDLAIPRIQIRVSWALENLVAVVRRLLALADSLDMPLSSDRDLRESDFEAEQARYRFYRDKVLLKLGWTRSDLRQESRDPDPRDMTERIGVTILPPSFEDLWQQWQELKENPRYYEAMHNLWYGYPPEEHMMGFSNVLTLNRGHLLYERRGRQFAEALEFLRREIDRLPPACAFPENPKGRVKDLLETREALGNHPLFANALRYLYEGEPDGHQQIIMVLQPQYALAEGRLDDLAEALQAVDQALGHVGG